MAQIPLRIECGRSLREQSKFVGASFQTIYCSTSNVLALPLATWKVWRWYTFQKGISLAFDILCVGLSRGAGWDIHDTGIASAVVDLVHSMDSWIR